jgi:hypothetical protein
METLTFGLAFDDVVDFCFVVDVFDEVELLSVRVPAADFAVAAAFPLFCVLAAEAAVVPPSTSAAAAATVVIQRPTACNRRGPVGDALKDMRVPLFDSPARRRSLSIFMRIEQHIEAQGVALGVARRPSLNLHRLTPPPRGGFAS